MEPDEIHNFNDLVDKININTEKQNAFNYTVLVAIFIGTVLGIIF